MRLFSASVRNARDHHAYSVMNAPPSRGHIPDAKEKAEMDKYYGKSPLLTLQLYCTVF